MRFLADAVVSSHFITNEMEASMLLEEWRMTYLYHIRPEINPLEAQKRQRDEMVDNQEENEEEEEKLRERKEKKGFAQYDKKLDENKRIHQDYNPSPDLFILDGELGEYGLNDDGEWGDFTEGMDMNSEDGFLAAEDMIDPDDEQEYREFIEHQNEKARKFKYQAEQILRDNSAPAHTTNMLFKKFMSSIEIWRTFDDMISAIFDPRKRKEEEENHNITIRSAMEIVELLRNGDNEASQRLRKWLFRDQDVGRIVNDCLHQSQQQQQQQERNEEESSDQQPPPQSSDSYLADISYDEDKDFENMIEVFPGFSNLYPTNEMIDDIMYKDFDNLLDTKTSEREVTMICMDLINNHMTGLQTQLQNLVFNFMLCLSQSKLGNEGWLEEVNFENDKKFIMRGLESWSLKVRPFLNEMKEKRERQGEMGEKNTKQQEEEDATVLDEEEQLFLSKSTDLFNAFHSIESSLQELEEEEHKKHQDQDQVDDQSEKEKKGNLSHINQSLRDFSRFKEKFPYLYDDDLKKNNKSEYFIHMIKFSIILLFQF